MSTIETWTPQADDARRSAADQKPRSEGVDGAISLPRLMKVELLSSGWLNKYRLVYELPDGSLHDYESISRKDPAAYEAELRRGSEAAPAADAASIIPFTDDGCVVLIKEFRYPLNRWCWAFPAGLRDGGEPIEECVKRELWEETGFELCYEDGHACIEALTPPSYSSNGMTEECVQIVCAKVREGEGPHTEPTEFIQTVKLPLEAIGAFLASNREAIGCRCQLVLESLARSFDERV